MRNEETAVSTEPGRIFREAWIAGVRKHYPGEPKPGYVAPWEETPGWERESAAAVYKQVRSFVDLSANNTAKLTREQKGRFVALCWIAQIHKHVPNPKPALRGRLARSARVAARNRCGHLRKH